MEVEAAQSHKSHFKSDKGRKAAERNKKEAKHKGQNPKAFAFQSAVTARRKSQLKEDLQIKKHHIPTADRTPEVAPPVVVAVVGPPMVGKTTLIKSLVKRYTNQTLKEIVGPVTIVTGTCLQLASCLAPSLVLDHAYVTPSLAASIVSLTVYFPHHSWCC